MSSSEASQPAPRRFLRWFRRGALLVLLLAIAGSAGIMIDGRRDRTAAFVERVGEVAEVHRSPVETSNGLRCDDVRLVSTSGLEVVLRLLLPQPNGSPGPAAVVLGGHRTGRDAVDLIGDPQGVVVAALNYPIRGESDLHGVTPVIGALPRIRKGLIDTPPAAALVARWLASLPEVDPERVELVGVSLGGVFGPAAAGIEPGIRRLWLVHGGTIDHREWLDFVMRPRVGWGPARRFVSRLGFELGRGPAYDPNRWLPRLEGRELVVVSGLSDERLPKHLVEDLLDRAPSPLRVAWLEGGHVDTHEPAGVRELIGTILRGIHGEPPPLYER